MRIASCSKLISTLIATLSLASLAASLGHSHLLQERDHSVRMLGESLAATDLFAGGSDQLTAAARAYVVTGDEQYQQAFQRELDTFRTREQAGERLRAEHATREELTLLEQAKQHSDALLATERQAFAAMAAGQRQQALTLLYSADYARAKSAIAAPIAEARRLIEARLGQRIARLAGQARLADRLALGLLGLNALAMLAALQLFYRRRLVEPLTALTTRARHLLDADGHAAPFAAGAIGPEIAELAQALEDSRQTGLAVQAQADRLEQQARELAASQERLRQTEAWYRGIIESAPDGVLIVDAGDIIRLANPRLESLFGYAPGELLGRPLASLAAPDAQAACAGLRQQVLDASAPLPSLQLAGRRRDGSEFPVEITLALLPLRDGQDGSLCAVLRDISVRQQAEAEMQRARQLAEQAAQAKSDFLANMSHEVRTPLNSIVGMAHLFGKTTLDGQQLDYLRQIQQASEQLRALVDDILDFSRIEAGELELQPASFGLQELLDGLTERFAERARAKGLHFACSAAPDLPASLVGDAQRIGQILAQFVDNAIKFTAEGEIEINFGGHRLSSSQIELNIFVRDTGIGLTAEQQEALFDSLYQADTSSTRQYGGTGLGLALSRKLAGLMDGSVGVQSQYGQGSTFWLSVPLGITTRKLQQLPRLDLQGCRVLLAEDHDVNQRMLCKLLEHVGVQVEVAENGQEAVERVRAHDYDLVLMDMQMPVLDGAAATLAIRQLGPRGQLPIVAISASAMPEDRRRCFEVGMNGFLAKPIKIEELYASLRHWCQPQSVATPPNRHSLPASATTIPLPEIPGLDTCAGLHRVLGDRALYLELLRGLVRRERDTLGNLHQALEHGDRGAAERMAHTLKGLAATVGAGAVMRRAAELEQALREDAPASDIAQVLERLGERLEPLLDALTQSLGTPPETPATAAAPAQLARICAKLADLLREDDAEAATWFNEQSGALRAAFADDYPRLENAIRSFEFTKALAALEPLMSRQQQAPHRSNNT